MKITYYLEVISSWCYWGEPTWAELKRRYAGQAEFSWKIALMPPESYPVSQSQCEWFYRRSGTVMRSPFMLNAGWFDPAIKQYLVPNYVAEAARVLGIADDTVRLALAHAAVREGQKVGNIDVAVGIAAAAGGLDAATLKWHALSPEIAARAQATTTEFHNLQVSQRPTFVIEDAIGDRAVFSGLVAIEPLVATVETMLRDTAAYASFAAHFGTVPKA
ncbi:MAG: DsbA family protein [Verrucomicrobiota bacterium]|nr:DsbA family protein [Verrucomicrobiota bacterium]